jgi:hypothetical protein
MPNLKPVLQQLQQQRSDLQNQIGQIDIAISALDGFGRGNGRRGDRRHMSAAGRKRIVAAQRARWAKWKRVQKKG